MRLALVVIIVVGLLGWALYSGIGAVKHQTRAELVESIRQKVSKEVTTVKTPSAEEGIHNTYISYKAEGYDYLSTVESSTSLQYAPKDPVVYSSQDQEAAAEAQNKRILQPAKVIIQDVLRENGFRELIDYPTSAIVGESMVYERETDVCIVKSHSLSVGISCATKNEFAAVAKEVKPFVEARRAVNAEELPGTAYGLLKTGTGETENDKYATLSTSIVGAFFYQENGVWKFLGNSFEGIGCVDLQDNPAAARAFSKICRNADEGL